jgi:ubiquitin-protein ligase E3 A
LDWTDGDVSDIFLRSFEISYEVYGKVKTFPLVDGGSDIPVTNANRKEYVDLYIQHYCNVSIKRQFSAFKRGFYKVCGGKALRMCKAEELELLLVGQQTTEYDFNQLEDGCRYEDFTTDSPIIQWFWKIVHQDLSFEQRKKLLTFVTASDRVPLKGLGVLTFVIQRNGPDTDRLPTALTCFGRLLLPEYSSYEKLKDRIVNAIENATGFGLL